MGRLFQRTPRNPNASHKQFTEDVDTPSCPFCRCRTEASDTGCLSAGSGSLSVLSGCGVGCGGTTGACGRGGGGVHLKSVIGSGNRDAVASSRSASTHQASLSAAPRVHTHNSKGNEPSGTYRCDRSTDWSCVSTPALTALHQQQRTRGCCPTASTLAPSAAPVSSPSATHETSVQPQFLISNLSPFALDENRTATCGAHIAITAKEITVRTSGAAAGRAGGRRAVCDRDDACWLYFDRPL